MLVKDIIPTDFVNYKLPSMYVAFPYCSFKCDKENGCQLCQNCSLVKQPNIEISPERVVQIYEKNQPLCKALVLCGLEPLDSFGDVLDLIVEFRSKFSDDIVIYTGYTEEEAATYVDALKKFTNIIVKFGRFRPDQSHHVDETLGVELVNPEQYAKRIS